MPHKKRDEECQVYNYEEWKTSDPGDMPSVWDQDVQDREELEQILRLNRIERLALDPVFSLITQDKRSTKYVHFR